MSDLGSKAIVICNSRFGLPAITYLHSTHQLVAVFCVTKEVEFEDEIKNHAQQMGFRLEIAKKNNWESNLEQLILSTQASIVLVKTFGFKIPSSLLEIPKHGFINFHYALLPQYRGAFPLFEVLKNKEEYGGISVHHLTCEFDKGPLVFKQYVPIKNTDTYGDHMVNLANAGVALTKQLMEMLKDDDVQLPSIQQNEQEARYIKKPDFRDLLIQWDKMTAEQIVALILASNYWSKGAITLWNSIYVNILYARFLKEKHSGLKAGTIMHLKEGESVKIACVNYQVIAIDTVFLSSGYLPAFELHRYGIQQNDVFGN